MKKKSRIQLYGDFTFRSMSFNLCSLRGRRMLTSDQLTRCHTFYDPIMRFGRFLLSILIKRKRLAFNENKSRLLRKIAGEQLQRILSPGHEYRSTPLLSSPIPIKPISLARFSLSPLFLSLIVMRSPLPIEFTPRKIIVSDINLKGRDYLLIIEYRHVRERKPLMAAM